MSKVRFFHVEGMRSFSLSRHEKPKRLSPAGGVESASKSEDAVGGFAK